MRCPLRSLPEVRLIIGESQKQPDNDPLPGASRVLEGYYIVERNVVNPRDGQREKTWNKIHCSPWIRIIQGLKSFLKNISLFALHLPSVGDAGLLLVQYPRLLILSDQDVPQRLREPFIRLLFWEESFTFPFTITSVVNQVNESDESDAAPWYVPTSRVPMTVVTLVTLQLEYYSFSYSYIYYIFSYIYIIVIY